VDAPHFSGRIATIQSGTLIPQNLERPSHYPFPVNPPSRRIHAPRPGLQETPQQFTAGPGRRCKSLIFLKQHSSLSVKKLGIPQPTERGGKP
ncbi:hypothetical protein, partial [Enterobacter cloacae]|uniref:hypothetical protein n=1 Tax=Enterobacter cloacae TaxID=550 RepID=UPI0020034262